MEWRRTTALKIFGIIWLPPLTHICSFLSLTPCVRVNVSCFDVWATRRDIPTKIECNSINRTNKIQLYCLPHAHTTTMTTPNEPKWKWYWSKEGFYFLWWWWQWQGRWWWWWKAVAAGKERQKCTVEHPNWMRKGQRREKERNKKKTIHFEWWKCSTRTTSYFYLWPWTDVQWQRERERAKQLPSVRVCVHVYLLHILLFAKWNCSKWGIAQTITMLYVYIYSHTLLMLYKYATLCSCVHYIAHRVCATHTHEMKFDGLWFVIPLSNKIFVCRISFGFVLGSQMASSRKSIPSTLLCALSIRVHLKLNKPSLRINLSYCVWRNFLNSPLY